MKDYRGWARKQLQLISQSQQLIQIDEGKYLVVTDINQVSETTTKQL